MWEIVPFPIEEASTQKWGELLQDMQAKIVAGNTNIAPVFEFKNWFELRKMSPGERCEYMTNLRSYYSDSAKFIQERQGLLEATSITQKAA